LFTFANANHQLYIISHLTIYRASAGSGKTYTLTREYIRLLLRSPDYHRRILAVTFTNKATEEMKSRIIRDLHRLATREEGKYFRDMVKETGIHENDLPAIASKTLTHLLHDYSHFSVVTIDSFFQKVIRSFAREMGLYAGYDVELDQKSVLDQATNLMLDNIDKNDFLKDWLVEWAKRKIEEGKSWNFKSDADLQRLGSEIFSEELQNIDPELLQETTRKEELIRFRVKLQQLADRYRDDLQIYGQRAISIMESYGLEIDHFKQKQKGVGGYFSKHAKRQEANINNSYVLQALEGVDEWYSKNSPQKNTIINAYEAGLGEILLNTVEYQVEHAQEAATSIVILKQINVLGVLFDLMHHVKEYTRDQNLFLLSEASGFLKTIIANADTPFIYERVGNFYNHFMIDEFQDTSGIQWDNFRPLIANSIASGYHNWIVGDVKQSIYRWRNTDWKILSEVVERNLGAQYVQVQNLDKNWRSTPEIVNFNNAFFREAVLQMYTAFLNEEKEAADEEYLNILAASMTEAYKDYYQELPERKDEEKGYVHLTMIPEEKDTEETWRDKALKELPHRIEELQDLGYGLSDIAILVRENKEAQIIADTLLACSQTHHNSNYRYDVLSNESLLIGNSPVVKWLVAAMRYITDPEDLINRAFLQHEYNSKIQKFKNSKIQGFKDGVMEFWNFGILESEIRNLPIYELSDKIIRQYNLYQNAGQAPFLQAFQDIILQYTRREATDIRSFLDWWDSEKHKKYITMPDNQDAIRLITIHKSKGLEFDAVIIPFCNWSLCKSGKMLWCQPVEEPFNDVKIIPLKFEQSLRNTIFVKEYLCEKMLSYIDNLNLLYVAFTRARRALFITTPQQVKDGFTDVKDLIQRIFQQPLSPTLSSKERGKNTAIHLHDYWHPENICFEMGELIKKELKQKETQTEYFQFYTTSSHETALNSNPKTLTAQFSTNLNPNSTVPNKVKLDKGRLLHDIFRTMLTPADLESCLSAMIMEGKLSETERTHIISMVHQALDNPIVNQWFAPDMQVKTEAEILLPDGSFARPDRIVFDNEQVQVIDYKFGELETKKYRQQVLQYTDHLRMMGYTSVKGYLWYVMLNKVEECC